MLMISTNSGGLSNRLKSYVSALRLDPNAKIYWPILDSYKNQNPSWKATSAHIILKK